MLSNPSFTFSVLNKMGNKTADQKPDLQSSLECNNCMFKLSFIKIQDSYFVISSLTSLFHLSFLKVKSMHFCRYDAVSWDCLRVKKISIIFLIFSLDEIAAFDLSDFEQQKKTILELKGDNARLRGFDTPTVFAFHAFFFSFSCFVSIVCVFHLQVVLSMSLVKALKLTDNIFLYDGFSSFFFFSSYFRLCIV